MGTDYCTGHASRMGFRLPGRRKPFAHNGLRAGCCGGRPNRRCCFVATTDLVYCSKVWYKPALRRRGPSFVRVAKSPRATRFQDVVVFTASEVSVVTTIFKVGDGAGVNPRSQITERTIATCQFGRGNGSQEYEAAHKRTWPSACSICAADGVLPGGHGSRATA